MVINFPPHVTDAPRLKMRACRYCQQIKPLTEEFFLLHNRTADGFASVCRLCHSHNSGRRNGVRKPQPVFTWREITDFEDAPICDADRAAAGQNLGRQVVLGDLTTATVEGRRSGNWIVRYNKPLRIGVGMRQWVGIVRDVYVRA